MTPSDSVNKQKETDTCFYDDISDAHRILTNIYDETLKKSIINVSARSSVVSDLRSETKGSRFESDC